ncbi:MAG: CDP-alcohol phosphatidyltransferase family protein [Candidatus Bathyarchaeota archaeon]|nr:CDP-alcohol phosphatidyltransferase family protein [Candidatus Bathyarchaeota archaeon]
MKTEAKIAQKAGLTPNHLSALGIILGVASGVAYWQAGLNLVESDLYGTYLFSAVILLLASGFCDALDGALARLYGKTSVIGGFLDSVLDRYVDASVYCGLMLGGLCSLLWGLLALVGSLLTSYARARSEAADVPMETVGVVERAERLLIIAVASLLSLVWTDALGWSVVVLALATNLTVLQRATYFFRKAGSQKKG